MSTTRKIHDSLKVDLSPLAPTKAFIIGSMPCEKFAADMRNTVIDSMKRNSVQDVAHEYLATRFMKKQADLEAGFTVLVVAICVYDAYKNNDYYALIGLLWMLPTLRLVMSNSRIHGETYQASEQWLGTRLEPSDVEKIKTFSYNKQGLFKLVDLLDEKDINTDHLKLHAKTTNFIGDIICCFSRRK